MIKLVIPEDDAEIFKLFILGESDEQIARKLGLIRESISNYRQNIIDKSLNNQTLLTKREQQVLELLSLRKTNKEIAELLLISKRTVEIHRANILRKLQIPSHRTYLFDVIDKLKDSNNPQDNNHTNSI